MRNEFHIIGVNFLHFYTEHINIKTHYNDKMNQLNVLG